LFTILVLAMASEAAAQSRASPWVRYLKKVKESESSSPITSIALGALPEESQGKRSGSPITSIALDAFLDSMKNVKEPQADALLFSKVEQWFLGMGFPDAASALTSSAPTSTSVVINSWASVHAKAFVRKALTDLEMHYQKTTRAQKELCGYQGRLCQEMKMPMTKYRPLLPSTDTFTGGVRQPAKGTTIPCAPFVSEGFDSYVLVLSPTGLELSVPFVKDTTTQDFKHLVADIAAIDVDGFVLSFGDSILAENDLTMEEIGVDSEATLGLLIGEPEMKVGAGDSFQKEA